MRVREAMLALVIVSFVWLPAMDANAAGADDRALRKTVLDNTISYQGHEFYRRFVPMLAEKTGQLYFDSVTLKESRSRRSGSLISIEHRETVLFQTVVYPGDQYLDGKAKQAAAIVSAKISQSQLDGLFTQGDDLAGNEL